MEAQTSAQLRAAFADVIAIPISVIEVNDALAMRIRRATIECALGAANAAGA